VIGEVARSSEPRPEVFTPDALERGGRSVPETKYAKPPKVIACRDNLLEVAEAFEFGKEHREQ